MKTKIKMGSCFILRKYSEDIYWFVLIKLKNKYFLIPCDHFYYLRGPFDHISSFRIMGKTEDFAFRLEHGLWLDENNLKAIMKRCHDFDLDGRNLTPIKRQLLRLMKENFVENFADDFPDFYHHHTDDYKIVNKRVEDQKESIYSLKA